MKYLVILLFFFSSCSSNRIIGDYASPKEPDQFSIKEDSTFTYQYRLGPHYKYSNGSWQFIGRIKIKLQSVYNSRTIQIIVKESNNKSLNDSLIALNINTNIPQNKRQYYQCLIYIDDHLNLQKNCDSLSSLNIPHPINTIFFKITADGRLPIRFLDMLSTDKYTLKNNKANQLDVEMMYNDSLFNYQVFNDEIICFSNHKLKYHSLRLPQWNRRKL